VEKVRFVYYEEDEFFVGWLEDYPDYRTQGISLEELKLNLLDLLDELTKGGIPSVRRVDELVIG